MTPNTDSSITTDQVAILFGIKPQSVGQVLRRRDVHPTHREPGRRGQNIYDRAAVMAVKPDLSITGPAEAPEDPILFARVAPNCSTVTTVRVVDTIAGGVPTMTWSRGKFLPTRIDGTFTNHHDGNGWRADVNVHGYRVLKNGGLGVDDAAHYVIHLHQEPEWIAQWAADNTPSWNPMPPK